MPAIGNRQTADPAIGRPKGEGALPTAVKIACMLLLAFPLFVATIRHWVSGIYILLCLLALPSLRTGWRIIGREERLFIGAIGLWLCSTLLSNTISGWTDASIRWYQADVRFLFAIPLFLFLRSHPQTTVWLLRGIPLAAIWIGLQSTYDTFFGAGRVDGPYGPIFFGNMAALLAALSLATVRLGIYPSGVALPLHAVGSAMALVAVVLSGTRSAWLAASLAIPLAVAFILKDFQRERRRILAGFALVVTASVAFGVHQAPELTRDRLRMALNELETYLAVDDPETRDRVVSTSVGFRLEQWRVALMLFRSQPLFGYGVGNVGKEINKRVTLGQTSRILYSQGAQEGRPTHLHSSYFDALTQKGIIGLSALFGVLLCPAYLAYRLRGLARRSYHVLFVSTACFTVFGLTEDPFVRNNFSSVYLTVTAALLAQLLAEYRTAAESGRSRAC